ALPASFASVFVNSEPNEGPASGSATILLTCIAIALCAVAPFVTSSWLEAATIIPALLVMGAYSASLFLRSDTYRSLHGIFPVASFMLMGFYAAPQAWQRRQPALF